MPLRLVLILTLLVQQLALPVVLSNAAQVTECVDASCCQVVETMTCCGDVVREMQCGMTDGACRCGVQSGDSEPAPNAPRPSDRTQIAPIFVAFVGSVIDLPTPVRAMALPVSPAVIRSHNEKQALLCIWRT